MDLVTQILPDPCVLTDAAEQLPPAIPTLYPPPRMSIGKGEAMLTGSHL